MYTSVFIIRQGIGLDLKSTRGTLKVLSRVRTVLAVCDIHLMKRKDKTMFSGTSPTGHLSRWPIIFILLQIWHLCYGREEWITQRLAHRLNKYCWMLFRPIILLFPRIGEEDLRLPRPSQESAMNNLKRTRLGVMWICAFNFTFPGLYFLTWKDKWKFYQWALIGGSFLHLFLGREMSYIAWDRCSDKFMIQYKVKNLWIMFLLGKKRLWFWEPKDEFPPWKDKWNIWYHSSANFITL